ncbi:MULTISPECIES: hypothetical protein [Mycobacterium]|uniref:hypothetical protein n=1 Tax=Mycobacterium TaxID=1763 RepID=UPI001EF04F96|nr:MULTISPECIES: hypothetical protein [Mycobacterium]
MQGVFIGTFSSGLREGSAATLIASIAAAFLTRNGRSTPPMRAGVALAVVVGVIAVVFVTSMIRWMNRDDGRLRRDLERAARHAISRRGSPVPAAAPHAQVLSFAPADGPPNSATSPPRVRNTSTVLRCGSGRSRPSVSSPPVVLAAAKHRRGGE